MIGHSGPRPESCAEAAAAGRCAGVPASPSARGRGWGERPGRMFQHSSPTSSVFLRSLYWEQTAGEGAARTEGTQRPPEFPPKASPPTRLKFQEPGRRGKAGIFLATGWGWKDFWIKPPPPLWGRQKSSPHRADPSGEPERGAAPSRRRDAGRTA